MKPRFRPVIRVFVSSTFSDLKAERNILQRGVFPRLEQYCLLRGFQLQAIDLRWGVPGEAGLDYRTMQICSLSPKPKRFSRGWRVFSNQKSALSHMTAVWNTVRVFIRSIPQSGTERDREERMKAER